MPRQITPNMPVHVTRSGLVKATMQIRSDWSFIPKQDCASLQSLQGCLVYRPGILAQSLHTIKSSVSKMCTRNKNPSKRPQSLQTFCGLVVFPTTRGQPAPEVVSSNTLQSNSPPEFGANFPLVAARGEGSINNTDAKSSRNPLEDQMCDVNQTMLKQR